MKQITLNIGGEERVFYFGLGFLGNLLEKTGVQMHEIDSKIQGNPFKWMPEIMYHSLAYGYIRKNENPGFDVFTISEWIDDDGGFDSKSVVDFFTAFGQSLRKDVPEQKEQTKKKVTKK